MKTCTKCLVSKSEDQFYRDGRTAGGLTATCRTCQLATHRRGRLALKGRTEAEIEAAAQAAGSKQCSVCKLVKVAATGFPRDAGRPDGRSTSCLPCNAAKARAARLSHPERHKARRKIDYAANRTRERARAIRTKFGITVDRYDEMRAAQGDACMICGLPETRVRNGRVCGLAVDHDHETGAMRDLLCSRCNTGLGWFGDDPARLRAAADYIERHRR